MNRNDLRPVLTVTVPSRKSLRTQLILAIVAWIVHTARLRRAVARLQAETSLARRQARTDPLTGLGNRTAMAEALAETHDSMGQVLMIGIIDLDDFKPINDTYGHDAGDQVLRVVAARLRHAMAGHGSAYRLGGDEFAVLWSHQRSPAGPTAATGAGQRPRQQAAASVAARPSVSAQVAQVWADRLLRQVFELPVDVAGQQLKVAGSLGVAVNDPQLAGGRLLRMADESMYRAKRQAHPGRDRSSGREAGQPAGQGARRGTDHGVGHVVAQPGHQAGNAPVGRERPAVAAPDLLGGDLVGQRADTKRIPDGVNSQGEGATPGSEGLSIPSTLSTPSARHASSRSASSPARVASRSSATGADSRAARRSRTRQDPAAGPAVRSARPGWFATVNAGWGTSRAVVQQALAERRRGRGIATPR